MAYVLKTNLANRGNYGSVRNTSQIKYIAIHFTYNDGDTDENNGKYFKNNDVDSSAHYFVDSDSVTQSVPDNYIAWSVGGKKYSNCNVTGGGKLYGIANNTNTLNIEICDDLKNGVIYPSAKTIENTIELTKAKMKEYGIPAENVIRHFDVNGKPCPDYWAGTPEKDTKWKTEFWNKLSITAPSRNYLMKGDKGIEVKTLQTNLIFVGYSCGSAGADGDFGSSTDSAVRKFQKDNGLVVDGKYGASSKAKLEALVAEKKKPVVSTPTSSTTYSRIDFIKDVQRAIGTTADGIVGSKTLGALITVSKSKNNRHAVVKPLQKYLNALGYNAGTTDSIFGTKTHNAVVAYQKTNRLSIDGIVGLNTWKKLFGK